VSFRGHGLVGKVEKLPDNYTGVVFDVNDAPAGEPHHGSDDDDVGTNAPPVATCVSTFSEIVPWCWSSSYTGARGVEQARDLVYVANLVCSQ
jgi:hypothetical protein